MLQSQMNNHELFCYIINMIDVNNKKFNALLDEYDFFCDLGIDYNVYQFFIKDYFPRTDFNQVKSNNETYSKYGLN